MNDNEQWLPTRPPAFFPKGWRVVFLYAAPFALALSILALGSVDSAYDLRWSEEEASVMTGHHDGGLDWWMKSVELFS